MQTLSVVHPPSADRRRGPRPARFGFRARLRRAASSLAWQTLTLFVVATLLPLSISFVHTDSGVRAQDVAGSALSLALVLLLWRRLATRLRALQAAAARWAQGDLAYRAKIGGADELGQLGATFDRMAGQIQETVQQNQVILREAQVQRDFALQVMNTMAQGLTVTDDRAHFEFVNPAYAQMLGYPPEALVGKSPLEVTSPDIHAVLLDARARRMVGETTRYETRLRRTDGSDVYALVTGAPRWRDGQVIGSISVITDLTERKRAEADLRRQYQEAESARSETRAVLDATNDAMCLFSPDRRLRMVNERFSELFGLAESDIVGRGFDDLQPEMERTLDDPAAFRALFDRAVAHPEQRLRQVIALRWPVPRELALYSTAVSGADGAYLGRLFVFRDVTREREVDRMKTEFVSLVSHELRTPLTSIKGYVDLLLDGEVGDVPEEQRDFLEIVRNNADRLAALINDLLDLSRIESGKVELKPSALDMARVIDGAVGALRPQIEAKGQRIGVTLAADLPPVWGDADRVNQILVNLLSNAYKYTPSGGEI
ncbi:MAG: PAS domain S-box protein, partial [Chloroflexota bacterium]